MEHRITLPLRPQTVRELRAGDTALLTGVLYTARDAAHQRLCAMMERGEALPFPLAGATLYYVGPTPAGPGRVIGSAGPTTSYRMDAYAPALLDAGLLGMIGKGARGGEVVDAMVRNGAVYFGAIGGAGALLAGHIQSCEVIAFADLGPEAVHRLEVADFPVTVVIDAEGRSLYREGPAAYLASKR